MQRAVRTYVQRRELADTHIFAPGNCEHLDEEGVNTDTWPFDIYSSLPIPNFDPDVDMTKNRNINMRKGEFAGYREYPDFCSSCVHGNIRESSCGYEHAHGFFHAHPYMCVHVYPGVCTDMHTRMCGRWQMVCAYTQKTNLYSCVDMRVRVRSRAPHTYTYFTYDIHICASLAYACMHTLVHLYTKHRFTHAYEWLRCISKLPA
jgi:hypothetical protein